MSALKSLFLTLALAFGLAGAAQAVTLANFSISNGDWIVQNDDNSLTVRGEFAANITGLMFPGPEAFGPTQVIYSATVTSAGATVFQDQSAPVMVDLTPPVDLSGIFDGIGLGWGETAFAYMIGGLERTDRAETVALGPVDLFFTYSLGATAPGARAGSFTATITRIAQGPADTTLSQMINQGLLDLRLLGIMSGGTIGPGDTAPFVTEVVVSNIPLPPGLLLLGAGLMGLAVVRRRVRA